MPHTVAPIDGVGALMRHGWFQPDSSAFPTYSTTAFELFEYNDFLMLVS